jgi:hypothetical protein
MFIILNIFDFFISKDDSSFINIIELSSISFYDSSYIVLKSFYICIIQLIQKCILVEREVWEKLSNNIFSVYFNNPDIYSYIYYNKYFNFIISTEFKLVIDLFDEYTLLLSSL